MENSSLYFSSLVLIKQFLSSSPYYYPSLKNSKFDNKEDLLHVCELVAKTIDCSLSFGKIKDTYYIEFFDEEGNIIAKGEGCDKTCFYKSIIILLS